ncbi:MAG: 3-deoxy-manno-octulosonate cytidylyltransferase [Ginsengibacter sp.]
MKTIALIPARYAATRFPGKLMQKLGDKTIIRHTYENTKATLLFDEVIVVTDSAIIFDEITHYGGYVIMSKQDHESGSDRIAEAILDIDTEIVVNVQGDEPFVQKSILESLLSLFNQDMTEKVQVTSLMYQITEQADIDNPNHVKVVVDDHNNALYFSRSVIPFNRNKNNNAVYFKHVGLYGFRKETLIQFTKMPKSVLESTEMLEQLRYIQAGIKIKMALIGECPLSIDTPEDLEKAKLLYQF